MQKSHQCLWDRNYSTQLLEPFNRSTPREAIGHILLSTDVNSFDLKRQRPALCLKPRYAVLDRRDARFSPFEGTESRGGITPHGRSACETLREKDTSDKFEANCFGPVDVAPRLLPTLFEAKDLVARPYNDSYKPCTRS